MFLASLLLPSNVYKGLIQYSAIAGKHFRNSFFDLSKVMFCLKQALLEDLQQFSESIAP